MKPVTYLTARNVTRNVVLGQKIQAASSILQRAVGLLATPALASGEGLWLHPCTSVHTFFMRYPIDVLFLSKEGAVLEQQTLKPWRVSRWVRKSDGVLELPAGMLERTGTAAGDRIEFQGQN